MERGKRWEEIIKKGMKYNKIRETGRRKVEKYK